MDSLLWHRDAVLGHAELDRQHQSLAEGISFLARGPRRKERDLVEWARFLEEIRAHFEWEEAEMERQGYPDVRKHRQDHRRQLANLMGYEKDVQEGSVLEPEIYEAMGAWNVRHIHGQDRDFVDFLLEHEVWQTRRELQELESELFLLDVG